MAASEVSAGDDLLKAGDTDVLATSKICKYLQNTVGKPLTLSVGLHADGRQSQTVYSHALIPAVPLGRGASLNFKNVQHMPIVTSRHFVSLTVTPLKAGMRAAVLPMLIVSFMLAACGRNQYPPAMAEPSALPVSSPAGVPANSARATATEFPDVDLNACLGIARGGSAISEQECPGFISARLPDMISTCEQAGGILAVNAQPAIQSFDVNGDAKPEILIDLAENYWCDGAPSVFSCGSLGCPVTLFETRNGSWSAIGALSARDAPAAEVLEPQPGLSYGVVRGGCSGERPCDELTHYQWDGNSYQPTLIEVRGHWVERKNEGLWTLTRDMPLLESPAADAGILDHYPKGTEVVVIGRGRDTPYLYVSPCNACSNGFIDRAHLVDATPAR